MSSGKGLLGDAPVGIDPKILTKLKITGPVTNSVFIYNLDKDKVTDAKLKEVFDLAGKVVSAQVYMKDGKSTGCGCVVFERNVEAVQAISMFHRQSFFGKTMGVKIDTRHNEIRYNTPKLPGGLSAIGPGLGPGGLSLKDFSYDSSSTESGSPRVRSPIGHKELSPHCGYRPIDSINCTGDSQVPFTRRSGGHMNFSRNDSVQASGYQSRNVGWTSCESAGSGRNQSAGSGRSYSSLSDMMSDLDIGSNGRDYRLPKSSCRQGGGNFRDQQSGNNNRDREQTSIICTNLPDSTVKEDLCQRFSHIGVIRYAKIMRDKDGTSRGCCIIRFGSHQEALNAVSTMNGFKMSSRRVEVRLL